MEFVRASSSYTRIEAHMSFKVKYSHNVFDFVDFKERCIQIFQEVAEQIRVQIIEIGFERNHVHMDIVSRPNYSYSWVTKKFKGTSGKKLLKEFSEIKKTYFWGSGLWSPAFYVDSVGRDPETIYNYIRNQGKKKEHGANHMNKSVKDFLRT
ncbi:MAG: IS200/IS605 family transposase [Candidatus Aenigmatarchaeota archaeon]